MSKSKVLLYWIFTAVFLAVVVGITRTWVPDWSYLNHDVALGIAGFWIYWLGTIAIAFSMINAFLLVYVILELREPHPVQFDRKLIEEFWSYAQPKKKQKRKQGRKTHPHKNEKEEPAAAQPEEKSEPEVPDAWRSGEEFE